MLESALFLRDFAKVLEAAGVQDSRSERAKFLAAELKRLANTASEGKSESPRG